MSKQTSGATMRVRSVWQHLLNKETIGCHPISIKVPLHCTTSNATMGHMKVCVW